MVHLMIFVSSILPFCLNTKPYQYGICALLLPFMDTSQPAVEYSNAFPSLLVSVLRSCSFCRTHGLHRLQFHDLSYAFAILLRNNNGTARYVMLPCHAMPYQSTLFVAFVVYDTRRQEAGRLDCCCCFKTKNMHKRPSAAASVIDPNAEWVRSLFLSYSIFYMLRLVLNSCLLSLTPTQNSGISCTRSICVLLELIGYL